MLRKIKLSLRHPTLLLALPYDQPRLNISSRVHESILDIKPLSNKYHVVSFRDPPMVSLVRNNKKRRNKNPLKITIPLNSKLSLRNQRFSLRTPL